MIDDRRNHRRSGSVSRRWAMVGLLALASASAAAREREVFEHENCARLIASDPADDSPFIFFSPMERIRLFCDGMPEGMIAEMSAVGQVLVYEMGPLLASMRQEEWGLYWLPEDEVPTGDWY